MYISPLRDFYDSFTSLPIEPHLGTAPRVHGCARKKCWMNRCKNDEKKTQQSLHREAITF